MITINYSSEDLNTINGISSYYSSIATAGENKGEQQETTSLAPTNNFMIINHDQRDTKFEMSEKDKAIIKFATSFQLNLSDVQLSREECEQYRNIELDLNERRSLFIRTLALGDTDSFFHTILTRIKETNFEILWVATCRLFMRLPSDDDRDRMWAFVWKMGAL